MGLQLRRICAGMRSLSTVTPVMAEMCTMLELIKRDNNPVYRLLIMTEWNDLTLSQSGTTRRGDSYDGIRGPIQSRLPLKALAAILPGFRYADVAVHWCRGTPLRQLVKHGHKRDLHVE